MTLASGPKALAVEVDEITQWVQGLLVDQSVHAAPFVVGQPGRGEHRDLLKMGKRAEDNPDDELRGAKHFT